MCVGTRPQSRDRQLSGDGKKPLQLGYVFLVGIVSCFLGFFFGHVGFPFFFLRENSLDNLVGRQVVAALHFRVLIGSTGDGIGIIIIASRNGRLLGIRC